MDAISGTVATIENGLGECLDETVADVVDGGLCDAAFKRGPQVIFEQTFGDRTCRGVAFSNNHFGTTGMVIVARGNHNADVAGSHGGEVNRGCI